MLVLAFPGWSAPQSDIQEASRLEAALNDCEKVLNERRQAQAGQDAVTQQLTKRVAETRRSKDTALGALRKAEELFNAKVKQPYDASRSASLSAGELAAAADQLKDAREAFDKAYKAEETAEAVLAAHRSKFTYQRYSYLPTTDIEKQCDSLRKRLNAARLAPPIVAQPAPGPASAAAAYPSNDDMLSGKKAIEWLKQHGYLNQDGTPGPNFHDWQSQTHSSLSRGSHPLRGVAGEFLIGRDGRITGPITISVERQGPPHQGGANSVNAWNLDDATVTSGGVGGAAPGSVRLLEQNAPDATAPERPPGYAPSYEEWRNMNAADQRYYFEAARARSRAEHEAAMAEARQQMAVAEAFHRQTYEANAQRLREGQIELDQARAAADQEAARAARFNAGVMASNRWMMDETQRLLHQQAEQEAQRRATQNVQNRNGGAAVILTNMGQSAQADAPVHEPARNALLQAIRERHQRWHAFWCPRLVSGCGIVPDGARDELLQWTRNASQQGKIERIRLLLDCYDSCVMANPKSERRVGQCRNECKDRIP
jgi:hypothetical protein